MIALPAHRSAQQGFTLIELIMVIVVLGILAASALPRFYDMQTDAREAKVDTIAGAVRAASAIAHSAALVKGQTGATGTITMEGSTINLVYGYPKGIKAETTPGGIVLAANLGETKSGLTISESDPVGTVTININGGTAGKCTVTYVQAASEGSAPSTTTDKTDC